MKTKFTISLPGLLAAAGIIAGSAMTCHATEHVIDSFADSSFVSGWSFQNWNGSVGTISWATNDAANSASSGSLKLVTTYTPSSQNGGAYRFPVNDFNGTGYTALEYDVKVDPSSDQDQYGTAADFKLGVFTTGGYNYHASDLNIGRVTTNGGWQHVVLTAAATGGSEWSDIKEVFIQQYDNNYTNSATNIIYVDNIKFTGPNPTYPDFTAFTFPDAGFLNSTFTNWYGRADAAEWVTNDASGSPSSGSMHIVADFTPGDNTTVIGLWFNITNGTFSDTDGINGTHYATLDMDILWDTNLSTVAIPDYNAAGDVGGMPLGLLESTGTQVEALGGSTTSIPNGASNGWVHISLPINGATAGLSDVTGLWFKKFNGTTNGGTAAFYVDNIVFKGAPVAIPQPTMTLSIPAKGLNFVNNAGGPYDRESLQTYAANFNFADQTTPLSYSFTINSFPGTNYPSYEARMYFYPGNNPAVGSALDYSEPNLLMIDFGRRNGSQSFVTARGKVNAPNGNGTLYDGSQTTFNSTSGILGTWTVSFPPGNSIIHVAAPDGSSTNMPYPTNLDASTVSTYFGSGGPMQFLFGGYNNGSSAIGQRCVFSDVTIKQGSTVLLTDNFLTDTSLSINAGGGSSNPWIYESGGTAASLIYLTSPTTKYFIDWSVPADGFLLQTNNSVANKNGWGTNNPVGVQVGDHYHTEIDVTNLPPSGNLFFRVAHLQ